VIPQRVAKCVDDDEASSGGAVRVGTTGYQRGPLGAGVGDDDGERRRLEVYGEGHGGASVTDGVGDELTGENEGVIQHRRVQQVGLPAQVCARGACGVGRIRQGDRGSGARVGVGGGVR